jgi:hydroxyisourate hydrolase
MRVHLHRLTPIETAGQIGEFFTNRDGRIEGPVLKGDDFIIGTYEWTFFVGDYFAKWNLKTCGTPFLDIVPIRFGIDNPEEHYHVPLLVSPWSYSTYRGS